MEGESDEVNPSDRASWTRAKERPRGHAAPDVVGRVPGNRPSTGDAKVMKRVAKIERERNFRLALRQPIEA
jgi:hypothetical protein